MHDDNDSDYKLTCANEETIDETRLPRTRELAYELSAKWAWAVGPDLAWAGVHRAAWTVRARPLLVRRPRLVRAVPGCWPGAGRRGRGKRRGRKRRRKKGREEKRREKEKEEKRSGREEKKREREEKKF